MRIANASAHVQPPERRQQLVPVDHGAKIRIHFFALRMERSRLYSPHFLYWQSVVEDHMAGIKPKLLYKDNSFEGWDSGYSDG